MLRLMYQGQGNQVLTLPPLSLLGLDKASQRTTVKYRFMAFMSNLSALTYNMLDGVLIPP